MADPQLFNIESLDLEGRGIARNNGKVVFIAGALPGEQVLANIVRRKPSFDKANLVKVIKPSPQRVEPPCPHFGVCGGCAMQHLDIQTQLAIKQRSLEDALLHIGKVKAKQILPAIQGPTTGYRHRARLSVRLVHKKGGVLVGFRERSSSFVADMNSCLVMPRHVSDLLLPLRDLIGKLSCPNKIPQIEVAVGDQVTVLNLRHLVDLTTADISLLQSFAARHKIIWWLQAKGPETAQPLNPEEADLLAYALPAYGLRMHFRPYDFTQVNPHINQVLVSRALKLLAVNSSDRVADLFCGLGNFSLPLATIAKQVVGFEGSTSLVARAQEAADKNGLGANTSFSALNLFEVDINWLKDQGHFDKILIDPPREGAHAIAIALAQLPAANRPKRMVYVSCNPATLARDASILVNDGGWQLKAAGAINMFPHTAHIESIAVFES